MSAPAPAPVAIVPAYRAPGSDEWLDLVSVGEGEEAKQKQVDANRDELKGFLLGSLQLQHLVVLAGSGASRAAGGPSMGDLWDDIVGREPTAAAKAVAEKVHFALSNKNIEALLSNVEAYLYVNDDAEVKGFLSASKQVILDKCSGFQTPESLDAHRVLLHRLSRRRARDQRLKVFTTNYDLCFEQAAGALGSVALDGFSFATPRRYDPRYFGYDIVRRPRAGDDLGNYLEGVFVLYKLHGSVNWSRSADGSIQEKAQPSPDEACLIYPASGKYQQSFTQPHLETMAQYMAAVREPNTCLVVLGCGFNDDHLAEPILAAAATNPHLRLIVVDVKAKENTNAGTNRYWTKLAELSAGGGDVWFVAAGFEDFTKLIPDLKTLTPAESVMRAIQGAARGR
jgi:hypothetical protein